MTRCRAARSLAAPLTLALLLAGCGAGAGSRDDEILTVLAASSLSGTFEELAEEFEATNPGVEVRLVLESSTTLAQQLVEGAPGDVFAAADLDSMRIATEARAVGAAEAFAGNVMVLAVPAGDPAEVGGVDGLDRPDTSYVTCVESAPCGRAAAELLRRNDVRRPPVSLEADARSTLAKVVSGEADAGIVFATDTRAVDDAVTVLPLPGAGDLPTTYSIAVTAGTDLPDLAEAWVALLTGPEGQKVLAEAGFTPPPTP